MLVRPCCVATGLVNDAKDGVGADEVPGIDGSAALGWIAVELSGIDGSYAAVRETGAGSATVELGLIDVHAFIELGWVTGTHAGSAGSAGVAVARGFDGRRKSTVIGDIVVDAHGARSCASHKVHQAGKGVGRL